LKNQEFNEEAILQKITLQNDYKAFEVLFKHYYQRLCNYALRVVPSPEVAEEVVSDVFFKFWKNRASIVIQSSLGAYLFRAVKNQALDYLKLKSNQHLRLDDVLPFWEQSEDKSSENPENTLLYQELDRELAAAIEALPPQCKIIFKYSRDEGLKYKEIAEALHISIKTVETQMGRALKSIREALHKYITPILFAVFFLS
jgi:RNA polymerase sigma-70 factor (ECF subfamily)